MIAYRINKSKFLLEEIEVSHFTERRVYFSKDSGKTFAYKSGDRSYLSWDYYETKEDAENALRTNIEEKIAFGRKKEEDGLEALSRYGITSNVLTVPPPVDPRFNSREEDNEAIDDLFDTSEEEPIKKPSGSGFIVDGDGKVVGSFDSNFTGAKDFIRKKMDELEDVPEIENFREAERLVKKVLRTLPNPSGEYNAQFQLYRLVTGLARVEYEEENRVEEVSDSALTEEVLDALDNAQADQRHADGVFGFLNVFYFAFNRPFGEVVDGAFQDLPEHSKEYIRGKYYTQGVGDFFQWFAKLDEEYRGRVLRWIADNYEGLTREDAERVASVEIPRKPSGTSCPAFPFDPGVNCP